MLCLNATSIAVTRTKILYSMKQTAPTFYSAGAEGCRITGQILRSIVIDMHLLKSSASLIVQYHVGINVVKAFV